MGFCIYCNQNVYSNTTCPKCYRTMSKSAMTTSTSTNTRASPFLTQKILSQTNTDKWQDTYGKKAIFNSGLGTPTATTSTPIRTRPQRKMPQFSSPESPTKIDPSQLTNNSTTNHTKCCAQCQQTQQSWTDLTMYNSLYYCKSCLEEKLACPGCHQPVHRTDAQAYFKDHVWHAPCFQCHYCKTALKTMLATVDSEGRPCCRTCQLTEVSRLQMPSPGSPSVSTPVLPSLKASRSTTSSSKPGENPYFQYQKTRRASTLSPTSDDEKRTLASITKRIAAATHAAVAATQKPQEEPKSTAPRKKKVVKKPCKECGLHVSKKDYRGLKIHTGQVLCFHHHCLFCAKCHQNFDGLEFCTDGTQFFHIECPVHPTMAILSPRQGSPTSEEDEAYPRTPSPQNTHFNTLKGMESPLEQQTTVMCNACSQPVTETCLELANHFYHKECLLCAGCNKTVPTDRKLSKIQGKLYCDHCSQASSKPGLKIITQPTTGEKLPKRNSITTPSDIFKSRTKGLPRLGGARTCARCNESMPFSDTQPGPNASRWHKKCLRCAGCKKQMDSDAHMTVNEDTGLCLVHCRECLDETHKPKFVR
ncbi:uncharacterized protein B0P05DRAFT_539996 [Gilbertella persicaria]|uniref:LIM zinc-binding domain-containing protein n=1 Tax=Rhizopus stolonifer TaxID=4846 RepID=A0A367KUG6_RHIST|nr:uncharacterized protein B0P05DRAFT_539996 [Gilbertella persicaria]KAI8080104.1 hypothetical protein B0P05DRAFT_539996 [Gilbertella persicaria]RCI05760.1 hypothetical protein CU098_013419 [Rhizopus stolonifer]